MNSFLKKINNPELHAIAVLSGTIIGVGIFGLPYVFQKTGPLLAFIIFTASAILVCITHILYGIIAVEGGKHRLVAYVDFFLDKKFRILPLASSVIGIYGSLIAYVLLGGKFLANIFQSNDILVFQILYAGIGTIIIYLGLKTISWIELGFIASIFITLAAIFFMNLKFFDISNLNITHFDWKSLFLIYGVSVYALTGITAVPEAVEILARRNRIHKLKPVILWGSFLPYLFYLCFIIFVIGLSAKGVSIDSISGLNGNFGKYLVLGGSIFGFFTTFTSFLTIGSYMHKLLNYDLMINRIISIISIFFVPLIAITIGLFSTYLTIIGIVGGIFISLELILILLIYYKNKEIFARNNKINMNIPTPLIQILLLMFVIIIMYEIYSFMARKS